MENQPGPNSEPTGTSELAPVIDLEAVRQQREAEVVPERAALDKLLDQHPQIPRDEHGLPTLDRWPVSNDVVMEVTAAEEAYTATLPATEALPVEEQAGDSTIA